MFSNKLKMITASITIVFSILVNGAFPGSAQSSANANSTALSHATLSLSQPMTIGWRHDSNLTLNLTPAFDKDAVYLPLAGGVIVSLNATDGRLNWRSEMGGELSASPVADQQSVYVATEIGKSEAGNTATGTLRALGREGGVTHWVRSLSKPLRGSLMLANGKLIAGGSDGKIYVFDSQTGATCWVYDYGAPFEGQPVLSGSRVFIGSEDGNLLALDENTGKLLWFFRTKGPVRGPVANGNDIVYFGSGDGYVYALNAANGAFLWRNRTGAGVQAVVRVGEELLVASLDNFVYKFSLAGRRLWKRQLPGRISSQPLTTSGEALFTPLSSPAGVVLEMRKGRQVNTLPVGGEINTSASPIAIGDAVLLTTEQGLLAFKQPRVSAPPRKE